MNGPKTSPTARTKIYISLFIFFQTGIPFIYYPLMLFYANVIFAYLPRAALCIVLAFLNLNNSGISYVSSPIFTIKAGTCIKLRGHALKMKRKTRRAVIGIPPKTWILPGSELLKKGKTDFAFCSAFQKIRQQNGNKVVVNASIEIWMQF